MKNNGRYVSVIHFQDVNICSKFETKFVLVHSTCDVNSIEGAINIQG